MTFNKYYGLISLVLISLIFLRNRLKLNCFRQSEYFHMVVFKRKFPLNNRLDGNRLVYHLIKHSKAVKTPIFVVYAGFERRIF